MVRLKYVYWCITHQQYVAPKAQRQLQDQLHCKIVKLNITFLRQILNDQAWVKISNERSIS